MMCGRIGLSLSKEQVICACSYKPNRSDMFFKPDWLHEHNDGKSYVPSYNIAPTDVTPVLVSANRYRNVSSSERILKPMMWGIIPPWHKGDYKTHKLSTNNCRLENIKTSRLFHPILINGGRCVIVTEGYYEWQTTDKTSETKQPYYLFAAQNAIMLQNNEHQSKIEEMAIKESDIWPGVRLLHLAGLYSVWKYQQTVIYSYSIITMESTELVSWLHNRMPAVLDTREQINAWLDIDNVNPEMALSYLRPTNILTWHAVSTAVNNSRNKSHDCNKRVDIKNKKFQKTLSAWFPVTNTYNNNRRKSSIDDENVSALSSTKRKKADN